jgi:alpha-tubulin suppressor-like RCC1 family protein
MSAKVRLVRMLALLALVDAWAGQETSAQTISALERDQTISIGQTAKFIAAGADLAVAVEAGAFHQCAVLQDGTARCWGLNDYGHLGDGTRTDSATPVAVQGLTGVMEVSGGGYHSCALLQDGTVRCWGRNSGEPDGIGGGQLGDPTLDSFFSATPVTVTGITTATAVAAGGFHSCALLRNGRVQCWGQNDQGQLGTGRLDPPGFLPRNPTPVTVTGITNAIAISAGGWHTCALLQGGTIRCWGQHDFGALGDGSNVNPQTRPTPIARPRPTPVMVQGITTAVALQAGFFHTCALLQDGRVQCWGWNDFFQLGNDPPAANASSTPVTVNGITNPAVLAPGAEQTCVVQPDGTMRCWGWNDFGQLGNGSPRGTFNPPAATVTGLATAVTASSGAEHTCAVLQDGRVQCWGRGLFGRLGDGLNRDGPGTTEPNPEGDAFTPVTVAGIGVTWASSDPEVATIDALTGVATARALGTTTITATSGGRSGSTTLTVIDNMPPALTVPANVSVNATSPAGAAVLYTSTATDDSGAVSVTCSPGSGGTFPIGTTSVKCTATDPSGNASSGSFQVTARGAPDQIVDLIEGTTARPLPALVEARLVAHLERVLADARNRTTACRALNAFIVFVRLQTGRMIGIANQLTADATRIKAVLGCP